MMKVTSIAALLFVLLGSASARADDPAPAPKDTGQISAAAPPTKDAGQAAQAQDGNKLPADPLTNAPDVVHDGTDPGHDPSQAARRAVRPADLIKQPQHNEIDQMLLRGVSTIPISNLVDETIDDLITDLNKLDVTRISPIAIRAVEVSPNLKASFARDLENRIVAAIAQSTTIKQISCAECRSLRSRVENGEWVVSLGPVKQADVAQLGRDLGIKAFLEIDFDFESGTNTITTRARLVRAEDGAILWSEAYSSDSDTAALVRGRERNQTRQERRDELQRLIDQRPNYGYAATGGVTILPWGNPLHDPVIGMTGGFRFYEKFGPQQRSMFGLDLNGFVNIPAPLYGGFIGMTYMYQLTDKSFFLPDVKVGGGIGGFLVGTEGNSFYFEGDAEMMLKFRLGVGAGIFYMLPVTFRSYDLGGVGYRIKMMFVW